MQENGSFVYTPRQEWVGEDSFTFTVTDAAGNVSHPATVRITVSAVGMPRLCRSYGQSGSV
ncbi:MAG: Ig-like domain-containing protein [Oscillospiraceae bacterium]